MVKCIVEGRRNRPPIGHLGEMAGRKGRHVLPGISGGDGWKFLVGASVLQNIRTSIAQSGLHQSLRRKKYVSRC